jgi:hypothetical protein
MARLNYDTSTVSPDQGRSLWAPGRYAFEIIRADVKITKSGNGEFVAVEFRDEESKPYWANYNVQNESADAERIGRSQFAALHHAAGLPKLEDTDQLIGRRVVLEIGVKKRKDTGEDENVVRGYLPAGTTTAPMSQARPATGSAPVPPWAAKGKAA